MTYGLLSLPLITCDITLFKREAHPYKESNFLPFLLEFSKFSVALV